jgi:ABC-type transport system involved in cytochrome c biogenesis ATPase subunit
MTNKLKKAFDAAAKLPPADQDALAAAILEEVKVDGLDVLTHTREVQARIGYLPENAPLYPELSVQAYLKMMADLREIPRDEQPAQLSEAIYATSLTDMTRPIKQLSKGFRQRLAWPGHCITRLLIFAADSWFRPHPLWKFAISSNGWLAAAPSSSHHPLRS